jgi:outer membrane protein assembly factor BamB
MPPTSEPRPAATEVAAVLEVIQKEFAATGAKPAVPERAATRDWVTFGYDPERSGWARAETALTKANAGRLSLLWKSQLDAVPNNVNTYSTLTQPLVVENVATRQGPRTMVFVASAENNIYALDNTTGAIIWKKAFPNNATPPAPATGNCPNNLNATPVIDKGNSVIYVLPNDGKLRGLSLADGEMKVPPTVFVPAFSRNFSLNLADGFLFTSTTRGCGNAISEIVAMNVNSPDRPVFHFYPSPGKGAGPWGKGGIVKSPSGVLAQTADGAYDPASGRFGNTILNLTNDMRLLDSYTPANEAVLNAKDYDLGSNSPVVFSFERWTLASTAAKEGVIYLLDAMDLGGADHRTPLFVSQRYGNDAGVFGYHGVWNALATWVDGQGKRWLFVPMYGPTAKDTVSSFPKSYGPVVNGSLMAFTVQLKNGKPILVPEWNSGDLDLPGTPVVANGVVYVMASGDRATDAIRGPRGGRGGPGGPGGPGGRGGGRGVTLSEVNPNQPGYEHDAAWRALQLRPVEEGGQQSGARNSGGRDTTHGVLYALDAATGAELFTSGEAIDSWNHDGNIALSGGTLYLSTYHGRVYAFGLRK